MMKVDKIFTAAWIVNPDSFKNMQGYYQEINFWGDALFQTTKSIKESLYLIIDNLNGLINPKVKFFLYDLKVVK